VTPLRILFSAYACEPGKGSEPGVGWRWALEAARLGHDVWVVTRANNAAGIERGMAAVGRKLNLHFAYYDLPWYMKWWKRGGRGVHLYYTLWQWGAYRMARKLHAAHRFDAVHHITFGVTRHASFMGRLGVPFVLGPLGGGETVPFKLRRHFALSGFLHDAARDVANSWALLDPFVMAMFSQANLILLKTPQTLRWLPAKFQQKSQCMLEIGIDARSETSSTSSARVEKRNELRLLYVGRFLYLKGIGLGLLAIAHLQSRGIRASLTLIGQGPEKERWRALAETLGISDLVRWVSWTPQSELLEAYGNFDAMLFPSLRDSSGNVVLEAMSGGLPVVCAALGGPAEMVDSTCGRVVEVEGRSEGEVVIGIADALAELATDPALVGRLRTGALARAAKHEWRLVVARVWGVDGLGSCAVLTRQSLLDSTVADGGAA
jgi:glycosyltransferase involved in cell wall biosynthesis